MAHTEADPLLTGMEAGELVIALPEERLRLEQDSEWCVVRTDDGWREFRFHDYGDLYRIPGLYERIFYDILKCNSPATVVGLLLEEVSRAGDDPSALRVLDLGAGNGMVGEELATAGADIVVGVDIIDEARQATQRDRPEVYRDYLVTDMTAPPQDHRRRLERREFNCLTCVAALGFGDIPAKAFAEAFNLITDGGWVAFNIKERFLGDNDSSGFARLIDKMAREDSFELCARRRYRHRLATSGAPLHYVAIVGRKRHDVAV